ncbi:MAG: phosphotransferase [Gammaproteobacteria bacterium]
MQQVIAAIESSYGLNVIAATRINSGFGTRNFEVIDNKQRRYFAKEWTKDGPHANRVLEYTRYIGGRAAFVPTPLSTRDGALHTSHPIVIALFPFVSDAKPLDALSADVAPLVGEALAAIHDAGAGYPPHLMDREEGWIRSDGGPALSRKFDALERQIHSKPVKDEFDLATLDFIRQKRDRLSRLESLLEPLIALQGAPIHGDFSMQNVLFSSTRQVSAVVDLSPQFFLRAWELGRIAFNVETICTTDDWLSTALGVLEGYRNTCASLRRDDIRFAHYAWQVQLIRSTYGAWQHYFQPHEFQADLDRFWRHRCRAATALFNRWPEIEAHVESLL